MAKREEKYPTFTTVVGTLVYPHLNKARDFQGDEKFAYDTGFVLTGEAAADLEGKIDRWLEESAQLHKKRALKPPYDPHEDEDGNEVEGATRFKFKVTASTVTKKGKVWDRKPSIFDRYGNALPPEPYVGSGTTAQIAFQVYLWKNPSGAGVSLQPTAILVRDFVAFDGSRGAKSFGFEVEEQPEGTENEGSGSAVGALEQSAPPATGAKGADF
jgi:hypothetical protein